MGKLFGTDGIRGVANEYPMTSEMAMKVGKAVASIFKEHDKDQSKIVIGKDTRLSGDMLEHAIASGVCTTGVDVYLAGILPTPGIAYLTASTSASAGIVISASHNPFYDNGVKIFKGDGFKLSDEKEAEIEQLVLNQNLDISTKTVQDTGRVYAMKDSGKSYANFLKHTVLGKTFKGLKLVMDCSNGATFDVAPALMMMLGAEVEALFVRPDGKNINENCGTQYPEVLRKTVVTKGADIGLAFDGDGDRLVAVDESGGIATGDQIIAICARYMKQNGTLKKNCVVSTVMSNFGLRRSLKEMGITHIQSKVGDRRVVEKMLSSGAVLGGEDSGHMVFLDHHTTGDGILTALRLIEIMQAESKPLSELRKIMTVFPQVLINVEVDQKPDIETLSEIKDAISSVERRLGNEGRVLVRYSGTEPLCRVMVEGPDIDKTRSYCQELADNIKKNIGK
jgi:phosphoglucosamine mutase